MKTFLTIFFLFLPSYLSADSCNATWTPMYPNGIFEHSIVYDDARNKIILFGGETTQGVQNSTWEWDGTSWTKVTTNHTPPARFDFAFAYDPVRNVAVLYGGIGGGILGDTWEYDGNDWTQKFPEHNPPALYDSTMTYDTVRQEVLMYGGARADGSHSNVLWKWNGTDWTEAILNPLDSRPEAVRDPAFSFDHDRQVAVLFGGYTGISPYSTDKTWEWNGTQWIEKTPVNKPFDHYRRGMAYDASQSKTILYSSKYHDEVYPGYREQQTWSWDGADWTLLNPATNPGPRDWSRLVYNSATEKIVLIGGYLYDSGLLSGPMSDVWELTTATPSWNNVASYPKGRSYSEMVYDSNRAVSVLFGGGFSYSPYTFNKLNDTWEYDGSKWTEKITVTTPLARVGHSMTFDSDRNLVVMFGGEATTGFVNETWEYDGNNWINRNPPHAPSVRYDQIIAYDPVRKKTVMFGGIGPMDTYSDTWEWNGTDWSEITTITTPPPPAHATGMTFDPNRGKIVLYNTPNTSNYSDGALWEFDGTDWNVVELTPNPGYRTYISMIFSHLFNKLFIFGGSSASAALKDSWIADLSSWEKINSNESDVGVRHNYTLVEDLSQNKIMIHGGYVGSGVTDQTWTLALSDQDTDGTPDCQDNCPNDPNKVNVGACGCGIADADSDSDGTADCLESCDNDPLKTNPGTCGCGIPDTDNDSDGSANCIEECDQDPAKTLPEVCGCGIEDADSDNDHTLDCNDACPLDTNKIVVGICGCGISDVDTDSDGTADCLENCDHDPLKTNPEICGCGVSDVDSDSDGTVDCQETCDNNPLKTNPGTCGCDKADEDTNANAIIDCLANQDITFQVKKILSQLKKKTYKKVNFTKLLNFTNYNMELIVLQNPKLKIIKLIKNANKQAATKNWLEAKKILQKIVINLST